MITELGHQLNMKLSVKPIEGKKGLPLYLSVRPIYMVIGNGIEFVIVELPDEGGFSVSKLKMQLGVYQEKFRLNVAYSMNNLSRYQREAMIQNGIPFVSLPNQIYLPFIGVLLKNSFRETSPVYVARFTPVTQALFLILAYSGMDDKYSKSEVADVLGVTNTTITRATKQLSSIGALKEVNDGTTVYISKTADGADYLKMCEPYLINPVQKCIYVRTNELFEEVPIAGESALSKRSMLNPPRIQTHAVFKGAVNSGVYAEVNPDMEMMNDYICLEEWKYSPELFARDGLVDPISLFCTLKDNMDERIEEELERMMEEIQWQ